MTQTSQTGRSMIEMLAVLMIIGVLTISALAGFTQVTQKFNTTKMHNDIHSISAEVVNLYAWQRGYPNSSSASFQNDLCENGVFPDGCDASNVAYNPFGGTYTVTTNTATQTLTVKADGLPESVCEELDIQEWSYLVAKKCDGTAFTVEFE